MSAVLDLNILVLHIFPLLDTPVTLFNLRATCRTWKEATESFKDWEGLYRTEFSRDAWIPNFCRSWFAKYWIRMNAKLYAWKSDNVQEIWSFGLESDDIYEGDVAFREIEFPEENDYCTGAGKGEINASLGAQIASLTWWFDVVYYKAWARTAGGRHGIKVKENNVLRYYVNGNKRYDEGRVKLPLNDHFADSGYRYQVQIRRFPGLLRDMHSILKDHQIDDVSGLWGPLGCLASSLTSFVALSEIRGLFVFRNIDCYSNCPATMVHIEDTDPRSDPQNQVLSFAHGKNSFIFVTARGWPYRYDNVSRQELPKELMDLVAPETRFIKVRVDAEEDFFALVTDKGDLILLDLRAKQCGHHVAPVKVELPFVYEVDVYRPALSVYTADGLYLINIPRFNRRCIGRNCGTLLYEVDVPKVPRLICTSILAAIRHTLPTPSTALVWAIALPPEMFHANVRIHRRSVKYR